MSVATLDHADSMLADAWACSDCDGLTYDASGHEPPRFCCRCGARFEDNQ
jgi:rubrerythrin